MSSVFPQRVAIIGLGYVGLPLAVAFGACMPTVGFDVNKHRVRELQSGEDRNGEHDKEALSQLGLSFTDDPATLQDADVYIVSVPTPVDASKRPDLTYLGSASAIVGAALRARHDHSSGGSPDERPIVVFESTVYPGCTEEYCVPRLEAASGLRAGLDFRLGYSPERMNPGDKAHTLENVVKVVAGGDPDTTAAIARLYREVVRAGVHEAPSIMAAEAAKVIENTQRDLNIALMNEFAILFERMGLDTGDVLAAAGTKWNFLPFKPGLVGGHCIPEDPYYLTYKAQLLGYHPQVILAGRRINDSMGNYVAQHMVRLLSQVGRPVAGARILLLGVTFKEDVRDTRNSRCLDIARVLEDHGAIVEVYDPVAGAAEVKALGLTPTALTLDGSSGGAGVGGYDGLVLAVAHEAFRRADPSTFLSLLKTPGTGVLMDLKGVLDRTAVPKERALLWRL